MRDPPLASSPRFSRLTPLASQTTYDARTAANKVQSGGTLTIGGTNTDYYTGSINWVDILTPTGYWAIPLEGIHVGGSDLAITADSVIIDSGTSLIGAPAAAVSAIYAQIPGSESISLDGESGYWSCESAPRDVSGGPG